VYNKLIKINSIKERLPEIATCSSWLLCVAKHGIELALSYAINSIIGIQQVTIIRNRLRYKSKWYDLDYNKITNRQQSSRVMKKQMTNMLAVAGFIGITMAAPITPNTSLK